MSKTSLAVLLALTGLSGLCTASRAYAKKDVVVVGTLEPSAIGGMHATASQKLTLSADKPTGITKEPSYKYKPQYGSITLGNAKNNRIIVVLDANDDTTRPKLYVDANGNGDLTDDPPVVLTYTKSTPKTVTKTVSAIGVASITGDSLTAVVPVVAHYDIPGRAGAVPSTLAFTVKGTDVTYNREYARVGTLTIGTRSYRMALVDQGVNGKFNEFKHEEGEPERVTLFIDRNNDGKFDANEAHDAAKPFRMSGASYEVANIDARGTAVTLKRSSKNAGNSLTAADLKVGTDVLDFEATTLDGKIVHFPDDFKGKVVLLDFWATWCPPCVEEVPNIVAVYNQYHKAGFDILGISLDRANQRQVIQQFMTQYNMQWPQVYDGGYWKAEVAQQYEVNSIPHAILVDGNTGKILAMGDELRGQGLNHAVAAALSGGK